MDFDVEGVSELSRASHRARKVETRRSIGDRRARHQRRWLGLTRLTRVSGRGCSSRQDGPERQQDYSAGLVMPGYFPKEGAAIRRRHEIQHFVIDERFPRQEQRARKSSGRGRRQDRTKRRRRDLLTAGNACHNCYRCIEALVRLVVCGRSETPSTF